MNNLFDSDNYPDAEPDELILGNRWAWTRSDITETYPTATYTLVYRFSQLASPFGLYTITAGKVSSAHVVEESQADTGGFPAGEYAWQAVVVRDSDLEEVTVTRGLVEFLADLGGTGGDFRSHTYQVLVAIRATILGTASEKQSSYAIGGRSLALRSTEELLALETTYLRRWEAEKAEIKRKAGSTIRSRVLVTMGA